MATKNSGKNKGVLNQIFDMASSLDKDEIIQNAFTLIDVAQQQVGTIRKGAQKEIDKLKHQVGESAKVVGTTVNLTSQAVQSQAKHSIKVLAAAWDANKGKLPPIFTDEVDGILGKLGINTSKPVVTVQTEKKPRAKKATPKRQPVPQKKTASNRKTSAVKKVTAAKKAPRRTKGTSTK